MGTTEASAPIPASWATPEQRFTRNLPRLPINAIVRKGTDREVDSHSAFRNNWDATERRRATGLAGLMRENGVTNVYVTGLARDVWVKWTALDAADLGFMTTVTWDLTRPVNPANDSRVREALIGAPKGSRSAPCYRRTSRAGSRTDPRC